MRWRTIVATSLLAGLVAAAPARSEIAPAEVQILRDVGRTYRALDRYLFQGTFRVDLRSSGAPRSQELPFLVAVGAGGRRRDQVGTGAVGASMVSDGRQTVTYDAQLGQYVRRRGNTDSLVASTPWRGVGSSLIARFAAIEEGASGAKRLTDEAVVLGGSNRDCIVLELSYPPPPQAPTTEMLRTFWIDKQTHLVLRQRSIMKADVPQLGGKIEQEENASFQRASLEPTLPESLWVFRPPKGSREVAQFTQPESGSEFAGKPAIDFTLRDLAGARHTLKGLRGKTVLLDFWATWCGPCRITMPQVAKIHDEYKNRGVEVMSINVGEPAEKASAYVKKNGYRFTTLLDLDRAVSTRYQVSGIPTLVVINRAGTVSDYLVGVHDAVALRAALKKAGVK
jgi:thiol-disulfide isomerase/thioredoxin